MKKKKLFSVFAVTLIAIFSVGCVFAAACGKKDKEEPEAEHVHEYTKVNYDGESHWYECSAGDGAIDESTVAPHEWDKGTQTTDPTCGDEGVMTYKCGCGATKTESINATGEHTFTEVVFTWTEDTVNGGYTATASLTCGVCGTVDSDNADVEASVTSEEDGNNTVYIAEAVIGGTTYTDKKIVENDVPPYDAGKNVYNMSLDFSSDTTYGWMVEGLTATDGMYTLTQGAALTYEIVTYTVNSSSSTTINKESKGALYTAGTGANFKIDLTGLAGDYITISAKFSANGSDSNRYMYVSTSTLSSGAIYTSAPSASEEDYQYPEYGQAITESDTALYIVWSANIRIFELEINIYGDVEPDLDVETPDVVAATVDTTVMSFTSAQATATANASYTVNGGDDTENKYTASVASSNASVATATLTNGVITVISVASGTAYITYSVSDEDGEVVASAEIYVAVNDGFVAYDEDTGIYTAEYVAVAGADGGTFVEFGSQDTSVFTDNCTGYKTNAKSTEDDSVTYSDYAETKSNKYITITVPEGATASITAYVSHTSKASRSAYLGSTLGATDEGSYIDIATMGSDTASPSNLYVLSGTDLTVGTYYIYGADTSATVHTYAVIVTYTYETAEPAHTHTYENATPEWTWTADSSSSTGYTATATVTCTDESCPDADKGAVSASVDATVGTIVEATCVEAGSVSLSATATIEGVGEVTGSGTVTIPATNAHTYETKYLAVDGDSATSDGWYLVCTVCGNVTNLTTNKPYDFSVSDATELEAALKINNAVITLNADVVGQFTVTGTGITLELNGHSITDAAAEANEDVPKPTAAEGEIETQYTMTVADGASLTIEDNGGVEDNGIICTLEPTNGSPYNDYNQNSRLGAAVYNLGTLTVESGTISSTSVGILAEAGTVNLDGGLVTSTFYTIFESRGDVTVNVNDGAEVSGARGIFVGGDSYWGYGSYAYGDGTNKTVLNVYEGAKISTTVGSAISTLGTAHSATVEVNIYGGEVTGRDADSDVMPAVYMPAGYLTISGGGIKGSTAVEVRAGYVTISGGTFTSTVTDESQNTPEPDGNTTGAVSYGYSLAIYPYAAQNGLDFGEEDFPLTTRIEISGGTFEGPVYLYDEILDDYEGEDEDVFTLIISGGLFSDDPSETLEDYLAEDDDYEYSFKERDTGYWEATNGVTATVYDFTDTAWTAAFKKDSDGKLAFGDILYLMDTSSSENITGSGLYCGTATSATNYYLAIDLAEYRNATSVSVTIDFMDGTSGTTASVAVWYTPAVYMSYSMGGGSSNMGNTHNAGTGSSGDGTGSLTYTVDFNALEADNSNTGDVLYVIWNNPVYFTSITITVVE